jgi:hypothetical protein
MDRDGWGRIHESRSLMKTENQTWRDEVRALMTAPDEPLLDYSADPIARSRLGRFLAEVTTRVDVREMPVRR